MALERTLSIIKPDATRSNITGQINARLGAVGFRIIAQKRLRMTRAQAMAQFPKPPVSSPHAYDGDQGEYLTWQDPGSDLGIRVELFEGRVTQMYWGTSDAIELIEGCA